MKEIAINKIKPNPNNPRTISDEKLEKLAQSLRDFPQMLSLRPLVVDSSMMVLGGNMRLLACKNLGIERVPVVIADELTEEQKDEFLIKDNLGYGEWDEEALKIQFDVNLLGEWGLELDFNVDLADLNEDALQDEDASKIENEDYSAICLPGDIWELGHNTLYCGDALNFDFEGVGEKTVCFTDPPYELEHDPLKRILLKTNCESFVLISSFSQLLKICNDETFKFHFDFVLNTKVPKSMNERKIPYYTHVNGVYLTKNGKTLFNNDLSKGRRSDDESDTGYWHTVINAPRDLKSGHGHSKNIQALKDVLAGFDFDKVVDPFAGSGTSLIAALAYKKPWIGCEITPKYCDLIIRNFIRQTGIDAINTLTGDKFPIDEEGVGN